MSNDKEGEKPSRRKSKGSRNVNQRRVSRPLRRGRAVVDGKQVNIPALVGSDELRKLFLLIGLRPRSSSGNSSHIITVPETDTGGLVEYTKALETMLKEPAKCPVTSEKEAHL